MDKQAPERPDMGANAASAFTDAGATARQQGGAQAPTRPARHGSERVYVDDLSYEPLSCIDTLLVTFAND